MSSASAHGRPPRQRTSPSPLNDDGMSLRSMRLKVLYTFDDKNQTNCLARWNPKDPIRTVSLDTTTTIGVIELHECISAITQCSPELVSRLGQDDYTVYAYDYSEYGTPLVGQGMLSRILAAGMSFMPGTESEKLVTGRVSKNVMGLFTSGAKETLEVKLRLVPVPKMVQNNYGNGTEGRRTESICGTPPNLETIEWDSFRARQQSMGNASQRNGMEMVNELLSPNVSDAAVGDLFNQQTTNVGNSGTTSLVPGKKTTSRPSSRTSVKRPRARKPKAAPATGGSTSGYEEGTDGDDGPAPKKKRARVTKAAQQNNNAVFSAVPESLRVAASTAQSLRMFRPIAMTTNPAAIAVQDIPRAPTPIPHLPNQHVTRDRAPSQSGLRRDSFAALPQSPQRQHISPYVQIDDPPEDQLRTSIETANPSPERSFSPMETPQEIGSSPPLIRTRQPTLLGSSPPCPSSPVLPQMPRTDSGFMSGSLEELFGEEDPAPRDNERDKERQFDDQMEFVTKDQPGTMDILSTKLPTANQSRSASAARSAVSRAGSIISEDGQVLPPLKKGPRGPYGKRKPKSKETVAEGSRLAKIPMAAPSPIDRPPSVARNAMSQPPEVQIIPPPQPAPSSRPNSRMTARTASMGVLTMPTIPASDPVLPPLTLQRSQTWSEVPYSASELPAFTVFANQQPDVSEVEAQESSRAGRAKKAAVEKRLADCLATGVAPPYCHNCGNIKTPTWRKAWAQKFQGEPGYYDYSEEPGRVTAITILSRDNDGRPTSYQLIKKSLASAEKQADFSEVVLCNPCGIWLCKYKQQRPEDKWDRNEPAERARPGEAKKRGGPRPPSKSKKQANNALMPTSEANYMPSDTNFAQSEAYHPQSEAYFLPVNETGLQDLNLMSNTTWSVQQPQDLVPQAQRPASRGNGLKRINAMTSDKAPAALSLAIQSSPARWTSTLHSPIEVEDSMGDTRRLLFPSPRKDGSPKVLGEIAVNMIANIATTRSPKEAIAKILDKENYQPATNIDEDDSEIFKLWEEELAKDTLTRAADILRPTTPVHKSPTISPFKTPTRPTPNVTTRSVSRSQRSVQSERQSLDCNRTPTRQTPRRSPRNRQPVPLTPFGAAMRRFESEAISRTSPAMHHIYDNMEYDFSNHNDQTNLQYSNMDLNLLPEDFFSTDIPMPSSPPLSFHRTYDDHTTMNLNLNWSIHGHFSAEELNGGEIVVKTEADASPTKKGTDNDAPTA